jgi:hypothetical protein
MLGGLIDEMIIADLETCGAKAAAASAKKPEGKS